MSEVAESLGQRLRAERERKGLSAQKAADELHLDPWVVDALENDDYARVGPSVYVKGHLKRYAEILGLPPGEIIGAQAANAGQSSSPPQGSSMRVPGAPGDASEFPWRSVGALVFAAAVVGAVVWWRPWQWRTAPPRAEIAAVSPSTPGAAAPAQEGADSQPAVDSVNDAAGAGAAAAPSSPAVGGAAAEVVPGSGRARLRLSFSADSWVEVRDAAGERVFVGKGHANSVKTLAGTAPLRVYLGSASGVQLEINNHTVAIGSQYVVGNVAHFEAGADGVLRRDAQPPATARPRG